MKRFVKTLGGKLCIVGLAVVLLTALGLCGYSYWHYQQPKFQGKTIELGQSMPPVSAFLTPIAEEKYVTLRTPVDQIDLTVPGEKQLLFTYAGREETVVLVVKDTTAPKAQFHDVTVDIHTQLKPEDFVTQITDQSPTTVTFLNPLDVQNGYGHVMVGLKVTDTSGNSVTGYAMAHYIWMVEKLKLELGQTVSKEDLLLNPERDGDTVDQKLLDQINAAPAGTYTVTSTVGDQTATCVITIADTVAPELELRPVYADLNQKVKLKDFIVKATDASGDVTTTLLTEISTKQVGTFTVVVEARDKNGNVTTAETTLVVSTDSKPPEFTGLTELQVQKGSTPDYTKGVKATDAKDGVVSFTYDAGKVNLSKAGTYYMTYTASDLSGNTVTKRRKVVVTHNAEDTAALVAQIASGLSSDAVKLRNYVRSNIGYNSNWGGTDPVWYGFKNKVGNCYVHAKCLDALLRAKGYETMLIWVTDKSHYWNLVKIDGQWKHLDSTPGSRHSVYYNPMNDQERYSCLQGRDWDRSQWPECP